MREIFDRTSRLSVWAFPFSAIDQVATRSDVDGCGLRAWPTGWSVYIGESGNCGRRLLEHAIDPSKKFAREVYVISAFDEDWFDKTAAIQLQHRLTYAAKEEAGPMELRIGVNPQGIALPRWLHGLERRHVR